MPKKPPGGTYFIKIFCYNSTVVVQLRSEGGQMRYTRHAWFSHHRPINTSQ